MEKILVLAFMYTTGVFIAFLGTMILARAVYDIVMASMRAWHWLEGRKRSTRGSC